MVRSKSQPEYATTRRPIKKKANIPPCTCLQSNGLKFIYDDNLTIALCSTCERRLGVYNPRGRPKLRLVRTLQPSQSIFHFALGILQDAAKEWTRS